MPVKINNTQMPFASEEKYLGITLNPKLTWRPPESQKTWK